MFAEDKGLFGLFVFGARMFCTKFETESSRVKGLCFHPTRPWFLASLHTVKKKEREKEKEKEREEKKRNPSVASHRFVVEAFCEQIFFFFFFFFSVFL